MKTVNEIVMEHTDADSFDVDAAIKDMLDLGVQNPPTPLEAIQALERFSIRGLEQLGMLVLQVGQEAGVLPEGFEVEFENLKKTILFHKLAALVEVLNSRPDTSGGLVVAKPTLVTP
jgi:hypothetical protein